MKCCLMDLLANVMVVSMHQSLNDDALSVASPAGIVPLVHMYKRSLNLIQILEIEVRI